MKFFFYYKNRIERRDPFFFVFYPFSRAPTFYWLNIFNPIMRIPPFVFRVDQSSSSLNSGGRKSQMSFCENDVITRLVGADLQSSATKKKKKKKNW